jgi:hypothetical protein
VGGRRKETYEVLEGTRIGGDGLAVDVILRAAEERRDPVLGAFLESGAALDANAREREIMLVSCGRLGKIVNVLCTVVVDGELLGGHSV